MMNLVTLPVSVLDAFDEKDDIKVCVFCDNEVTAPYCRDCGEYKGIMTVREWEEYTGEEWC